MQKLFQVAGAQNSRISAAIEDLNEHRDQAGASGHTARKVYG